MGTLIGTSGWTGFSTGADPLKEYSKVFNIVEVDTTFYKLPGRAIIDRWKEMVEENTSFIIKANKVTTHNEGFRNTDLSFLALSRTYSVARQLGADGIVFEVKRDFELSDDSLNEMVDLLKRERAPCNIYIDAHEMLSENNCSILKEARVKPVHHPIAFDQWDIDDKEPYIRISEPKGRGYQPDDSELEKLKQLSNAHPEARFIFTGQRRYNDALRFRFFEETGQLLPTTSSKGVDSIMEVLNIKSDALPIKRDHIVDRFGGLLFDLDEDIRSRLDEYLSILPKETYWTIDEITKDLSNILEGASK